MALQIDNSISHIARELRPAQLRNLSFAIAIEDYLKRWANRAGIPAKLDADGLRDVRFKATTENHLFRIVQESLNNTLKHARAKRVEIQFQKREDENVMIIMDDGRGFDVTEKMQNTNGLGLLGMRERAQVIGGSCEIESTVGEGTTIYVHFPENGDIPHADGA